MINSILTIVCLVISSCSNYPAIVEITDLRKGVDSKLEGDRAINLRKKIFLIYSKAQAYQYKNNKSKVFTPEGGFITRQDYTSLMIISFKSGNTTEIYELGRTLDGRIALSFGEDTQLYIPDQNTIKDFLENLVTLMTDNGAPE